MVRVGTLDSGYTIIEVMIFLAISSVVFLFAVEFINGKQSQVEFSQGMANIKLQLQQVASNVVNGSFSERANFSCSSGSTNANQQTTLVFNNTVSNTQGSNGGCMLIGYGVQYDVQGTNGSGYAIVPVAVSRVNSSGQPTSSLSEAVPTPITADLFGTGSAGIDLVQSGNLEYGIQVTKMYWVNNAVSPPSYNPIDGFAIFYNVASNNPSNNSSSSVQSVSLYKTGLTAPAPTEKVTGSSVNPFSWYITQIQSSDRLPSNDQIIICFNGAGSSSQKASIVLGSSGNQMAATMHLIDGVSSECL